jgi:hypothetical protein
MPEGFENRLAANWRLLLATADLAENNWPIAARKAAVAVSQIETSASRGVELLIDIRRAFETACVERLSSEALIGMLVAEADRPWGDWHRGKPLSQRQLAGLLRDFKISSRNIRVGASVTKGYEISSFTDAFSRYLPLRSATALPRSDGNVPGSVEKMKRRCH